MKTPPFRCLFCGHPSWVDPSDQSPPPDYCHESDHGDPANYEEDETDPALYDVKDAPC